MCIRDSSSAEGAQLQDVPNWIGPMGLEAPYSRTRHSQPVSYTHLDVYKRQVY